MDIDFIKKIEWSPINILKGLGLFLVGLVILSIVLTLLKPLTSTVTGGAGVSIQAYPPMMYGSDAVDGYSRGSYAVEESVKLSLTNVDVPMPIPGGTVGGDAEEYEVMEYSAYIETTDKDETCLGVSKLKELDYVVFENSNEHDRGCSYTFKVEHAKVEEVLAVIKTYEPRDLTENAYTIQRQLDDFTSETEILEKKLANIDATLVSAIDAYDDVTELASRTGNAEALANIISSRIGIIERLTQERINTVAQLERLSRGKAEQLDKLDYTYFSVSIFENKYVDFESIRDSWKQALQTFVYDMNRLVQDITINLVALLFLILQYLIYFFILVLVAKYVWKGTKYVWNK